MGNLRQVEETSSSSRSAPRLELIGRDRAGLQGGGRWALCTLGARILLQLLDAQYDPRSKNMRLARFAILNLRTHAGHPDVDAGRTRDVDALD